MAETNVKEVVLTGVNLGDFGVTHGETFYDLLLALKSVKGIDRYRISSIEPNLLEDRIIDLVAASSSVMPHFHIPLQSGSNDILKSMRRKYQRELYQEKVQRIKENMPDCAIGVDVIVGYPGENDVAFLETYEFLNQLDVTYLHVFPYSERAQTTAVKLKGKVHQYKRNERVEQLRILSEKKQQAFYRSNIGQTRKVLFEHEEKQGKMYGYTDNYIKVEMDYDPLLINELVDVIITGINSEGFASAEFDYSQTTVKHVS